MALADSAAVAFALTAVLAVAARAAGALTTSGALAGAGIGLCVAAGLGVPGLLVLGTFFLVGTIATRIGWKTKEAGGTAEAGLDYQMSIWAGIFAPKGTPKPVVDKLAAVLAKTLDEPAVQQRLTQLGGAIPSPAERTPEKFESFVKAQIAHWSPILKAAAPTRPIRLPFSLTIPPLAVACWSTVNLIIIDAKHEGHAEP